MSILGGIAGNFGVDDLREGFSRVPEFLGYRGYPVDEGNGDPEDIAKAYIRQMHEDGPPQYEGPLHTTRPEMETELADIARQQMMGEGLGMDPRERELTMRGIAEPLAAQRRQAERRLGEQMAARGMADSGVADQARMALERGYGQALGEAERDITLQDLQLQRQQQEAAQQRAMQLAQMQQARQEGDMQRAYQHWVNAQQLEQLPYEMAMQYLTGVTLPREQMELREEMYEDEQRRIEEEQERQDRAGFWGGVGTIGGGIVGGLLGGPAGAAAGAGIGGQAGQAFG